MFTPDVVVKTTFRAILLLQHILQLTQSTSRPHRHATRRYDVIRRKNIQRDDKRIRRKVTIAQLIF